ncbi:MAG TPA: cytochrome b5-like heme/steroid binding domain-containing protein [Microbacteriaceae bacterium]|nr:cytochrome b5-like heme/steroid binding domain-containing protein [Microbacteriaceae bacterium]
MTRLAWIGVAGFGLLLGIELVPESTLGVIGGLPSHPLVVHGAVVLLPLAALALAARLWFRNTPGYVDGMLLGLGWVGSAAAVAAEETGKALAAITGLPAEHAEWGERLGNVALVWFAAAVVALVFVRRTADTWRSRFLAPAASLSALVVLVLVILAGHSGATAVWGGRIVDGGSAPTQTQSADVTPSASPSPSSSSPGNEPTATVISAAEVASHASAESCWTVIDGTVYDLTPWITEHPGGARSILELCGRDGTAAFMGQHGGQRDPARELKRLALGTLG